MTKEAQTQRAAFLKKFSYAFFCFFILTIILSGFFYFVASSSIAFIFLIACSVCLFIYCLGFFNVAYYALSTLCFPGLFGACALIYFIQGMLNNSYAAYQQGDGLDLPIWLSITIVLICIGFFSRFFYKLYKTINFDTYFKETLAANNYDLKNKIYYVDGPNKEPEFEWNFLKKFAPFLHPGYAIIMSKTHSIGMGYIGIVLALPISVALIYFTLVLYIPYRSYKRIQQELGASLKPAILNVNEK